MCTLSWIAADERYEIFFNRDERRSRRPAAPPEIQRLGPTRFVAPLDGDHGGTWVAVSEHGLSLCLLNGFGDGGDPTSGVEPSSRGEIPLRLIGAASAVDATRRLSDLSLDRYRPFMLAAFAPGEPATLGHWSGTTLQVARLAIGDQPLVSSSFYTEEVRSCRTTVFGEVVGDGADSRDAERHLVYHESHRPERGPYSTCMHREDAHTVSFSRIQVAGAEIRFHYTGRSPCRGRPTDPAVVLERTAVSG